MVETGPKPHAFKRVTLPAAVKHKLLRPPFWNPYYDSSDPKLWREEAEIVGRLLAGEELTETRYYIQERDTYAVGWVWSRHPDYPAQWDVPVCRLMSRGVLRSSRCAGGFTKMVLTPAAAELLETLKGQAPL